MIVVVGPSGVGKSSFVERLASDNPAIVDIITYTTRAMREGEREGSPYHFVTPKRFHELKASGFFVEVAENHGRLYGTPKDQISNALSHKRPVVMDVDVKGARTFQSLYPGCLTLFIHPPNMAELRQRIVKRESKEPHDLELRLRNAEIEISQAHEFDTQMTNGVFESSYAEFKKIVEDFLATP
jgi:guanylate kinase